MVKWMVSDSSCIANENLIHYVNSPFEFSTDSNFINSPLKEGFNRHPLCRHTAFRSELLEKQNYQCTICGIKLHETDSHLDHIIPWDYVGDELQDNYQMLCCTCNERKGTLSYFELSMLLLKIE